MHPCLSQLFMHFLKNPEEDIDVLNRAGYFYNMLKDNFEQLRESLDEVKYSLKYMENLDETDVDSNVIKPNTISFNSLEVIYKKPAESFIKPYEYFMNQRHKEKAIKMEEEAEIQKTEDENGEIAPENGQGAVTEVDDLLEQDQGAQNQQTQALNASTPKNISEEDQGKLFNLLSSERHS